MREEREEKGKGGGSVTGRSRAVGTRVLEAIAWHRRQVQAVPVELSHHRLPQGSGSAAAMALRAVYSGV